MSTEKQPVKRVMDISEKVSLHNSHLVGNTLKLLVADILDSDMFANCEVFGIVYEEDKPVDTKTGESMFASFYPICKTFVVNLQRHWEDALAQVQKEDNHMRLDLALWFNLFLTHIHELKHCMELYEMDGDLEKFKQNDEVAQDWAYEAMFALAAEGIDIEPPDLMEDPFFGELITRVYEEIMAGEEPWQKFQYSLMERSLVAEEGEHQAITFRDYLMMTDPDKDRVWAEIISHDEEELVVEESAEETAALAGLAEVATAAETIEVAPTVAMPEMPITPEPRDIVSEVPVVLPDAPPAGVSVQEDIVQPASTLVDENSLVDEGDDTPVVMPTSQVAPAPAQTVAENPGLTVDAPTLTPAECAAIMDQVYIRLYGSMFNKCGFNPGSDQGFLNPAAILDPVYIGDIVGVDQLVKSYDTINVQGELVPHVDLFGDANSQDGYITGTMTKDKSMPAYIIYVNIGGRLHRRSIRPQNCNKMSNGTLTKFAQDARNGVAIGLVYRDLSPVEQQAGWSAICAKLITNPGQKTVLTVNPFEEANKREVVVGG